MSLDVKSFLRQLFTASESDKDNIISEFQGDVGQARAQLEGAEKALLMVRGMLGRSIAPPPAPLDGTKPNGQAASGTRKPRNGSSSVVEAELVTVFDLIQAGTGKIGDLMAKTGQDRLQLKKLLGVMSDRGLVEMTGYKGGARYHLTPGAVRPLVGQAAPLASTEESQADDSPPAPSASSAPEGEPTTPSTSPEAPSTPAPAPQASAAPDPSPAASPSPGPASPADSPSAATNDHASPEPAPAANGAPEHDPRGKNNRRPQPQHARR